MPTMHERKEAMFRRSDAFIVQSAIDPRLADLSLVNPLAAIFSVYRALILPGTTLPDSPMPAGQLDTFKKEDVLDLVFYLEGLK